MFHEKSPPAGNADGDFALNRSGAHWRSRKASASMTPPLIRNGSLNSSICVAPVGSTGVQDGDSSDDRPDARDGDSTARNPS